MFLQYHRYENPYQPLERRKDPRLLIAYPSQACAMGIPGNDFYVIGSFQGIQMAEDARLLVRLIRLSDGHVVRTVRADSKENQRGIRVDFEGMETQDSEETVRSCGMPDLVWDPELPESFWYTWNKAYFTEHVYAALIYGGAYRRDRICQTDQEGRQLEILEAGIYEIEVTLENGDERISSSRTMRIEEGQKEIILSRYSPQSHVERVARFAKEHGFGVYSQPYPGVWDTRYFQMEWPAEAYIEIPERWHWGDAREYQADRVHFFDYNITEACVGYQIEIAGLLEKDRRIVDQPERMAVYYYRRGEPEQEGEADLGRFEPGQYLAITGMRLEQEGEEQILRVSSVCKPLPSAVKRGPDGSGRIEKRVAFLDYRLTARKDGKTCEYVWNQQPVGQWRALEEGGQEFLILQSEHRLSWTGRAEFIELAVWARDQEGALWDHRIRRVLS